MRFIKKRITKPHSILKLLQLMMVILVPILIFNIIISINSIVTIRKQYIRTLSTAVQLYINDKNEKLKVIENFINKNAVDRQVMERMDDDSVFSDMNEAVNAFRQRINALQMQTDSNQLYMLYLENRNYIFNASTLTFPYSQYTKIKNFIRTGIDDHSLASYNGKWHSITLGSETYLFYMTTVTGRSFSIFIPADALPGSLNEIDIGKNGNIILTLDHEGLLFETNEPKEEDFLLKAYTHLHYGTDTTGLPYQIDICFNNLEIFGNVILPQLITSLTIPMICMLLLIYLWYTYNKLISPLHRFSEQLACAGKNNYNSVFDINNSHIAELQETSQQFNNLIKEVKLLRFSMYEHEIELQKSDIALLQSQIKPHFYLNCLTTISSMSVLNQNEDIQKMIMLTSRYLRYLFQTNNDYVALALEMDHVCAYMEIQKLRLGDIFRYTTVIDPDAEDALIPPLVLFTFAENSLKHNDLNKNRLDIQIITSLSDSNSGSILTIDIIDNGIGFTEQDFDVIRHQQPKNDSTGVHVGIYNSIRRIGLMYGDNGNITFSNNPDGGAHIRITLPYFSQQTPKGIQ